MGKKENFATNNAEKQQVIKADDATANKAIVEETKVGNTETGETTIADQVVAKIAGLAAREIPGVYNLGGSAARALGAIRETVGLDENVKQGISVEVGKTQAAVDLTLIVEYPYPVHEVAQQVREAIFSNIEGLVGLEVTEVNIQVTDVHIETENTEEATEAVATKQERVK